MEYEIAENYIEEELIELEELGESEILNLEGIERSSLVTQKSEPLYEGLSKSNLAYEELFIIDTYLGRIDSHNPNARAVMFGKKTLEKIWGKTKINNSTLKKWIHNLTHIPIDVSYKNGEEITLESFNLFEGTRINGKIINPDDSEEEMIIDVNYMILECTQRAVKYIFNIESLGYLRYRVSSVASLGGRQAYDMFLYIEKNRFRKKWDEDVETLKIMFKCENNVTYDEYKFFNAFILKKTHERICKNTKCRYTYSPIKRGNRVIKIHFEVEELPYEIMDKEIQEKLYKEKMEKYPFWTTAFCTNDVCEFTESQLNVIAEVMVNVPENKLLKKKDVWGAEASIYNYMAEKYAILNQVDEEKRKKGEKIEKRFEYLVQMIRKDTEE